MRYIRSEVFNDVRQPYFRFFPSDWRGDQDLKACSLAARGLWIEMIAMMHGADPYGHLVAGKARLGVKDVKKIAAQIGCDPDDCKRALRELSDAGVFSIAEDGTVFSRRMVSDAKRSETNQRNGKNGGSPALSVNRNHQQIGLTESRTKSGYALSGSGSGSGNGDVLDSEETSPRVDLSPAFSLAVEVIGRGLEADVIEQHLALDVNAAAYRQIGSAETLLAAYGHEAVIDRVELYIAAYRVAKITRRLSCLTLLDTWGWDNIWNPRAKPVEANEYGESVLAGLKASGRI